MSRCRIKDFLWSGPALVPVLATAWVHAGFCSLRAAEDSQDEGVQAEGRAPLESHRDLLSLRGENGRTRSITTTSDWEQLRRTSILRGFERAAGPLHSREDLPNLEVQVRATMDREKHTLCTIDFVSESGDRTSCFLYLPKGLAAGQKRPGIVALHPTHRIGKGVVDGRSERPNRGYARELADRGYVVIAPDYPSFGDQADYDFARDRHGSGTMKGIWNHMRCVDLLQARPEVDKRRIGAIGHSLGGHNAIFLGVFDERVKVVVSSCGWTPFHDYYGGKIKGWTSERYLPKLRTEFQLDPDRVPFDFYGLIAALAPRAFFSNSPLRDANFDYRGVEKAAPVVRRVYDLYGVPENLRIAYPDAGHDFPVPVREEAFRFLDAHLRHTPKSP